jgi:hypothetical protein
MPRLLCLPLLLLATSFAGGHDFWLQPGSFFPEVNKPTEVHLHVGDHFTSEKERPFQKKATSTFRHLSAGDSIDLSAAASEGDRPVAKITPKKAGTHLIALERDRQLITLGAKKFSSYLAEEGLDGILEERRKLGESDKPGRERYWRSLKSLLRAGDKGDDTWKKALGQKLDIVPLIDPTGLKAGSFLEVRILLFGKPLAGATVSALNRSGGKTVTLRAKSSSAGKVGFKLGKPGAWLVRLVHMRRAKNDKQADWESFWSALTFAIGSGAK